VPDISPAIVNATALNSKTLFVQWKLLDPKDPQTNGIVLGYKIRMSPLVDSNMANYETTVSSDKNFTVITDLSPYSWYNVSVGAYTRKGLGVRGFVSLQTQPEG